MTGREPAIIGLTGAPLAANAPSAGGIVSLLLACLPYAMLVGMLPGADDFPGEGGGEAQYSWGFQQFWAYISWSLTVALLWLALWRASRRTSGWAGRMIPLLVMVMVFLCFPGIASAQKTQKTKVIKPGNLEIFGNVKGEINAKGDNKNLGNVKIVVFKDDSKVSVYLESNQNL